MTEPRELDAAEAVAREHGGTICFRDSSVEDMIECGMLIVGVDAERANVLTIDTVFGGETRRVLVRRADLEALVADPVELDPVPDEERS